MIAFRLSQPPLSIDPIVTSNNGPMDATALLDDDLNSSATLVAPEDGGPAWIQYEFAQPVTIRAVTVAGVRGIPAVRLWTESEAGRGPLVTMPGAQKYRPDSVATYAFAPATSRCFRLELTGSPLTPAEVMGQVTAQPAKQYGLAEFKLHTEPRVHRWEAKAGFGFLFEYDSVPTPVVAPGQAIACADVIDLSKKMDDQGHLHWEVPSGQWIIQRLGYSLTGARNRPATAAGLGYEVDKLSPIHTRAYIEAYTDLLSRSLGDIDYLMMDSWEAGMQNWTDNMITEFQQRRGYSPLAYLPVLTGRVVGSAEISDRFLWDFRRSLADMFAENHYGVITDFLHKRGVGTYGEASGVSLEILEDALLCKKQVDIPMGEFWVRALHPEAMYYEDVRGAASAGHIYGKPIIAAEAFTGGRYETPYTLKQVADYWFCQGVNRLVFHTSAHQPLDTQPGNVMVGTHLHRNITWAEQAGPWLTYLSRISGMLQQGHFVADLVYLLPEGAPSTMPFWGAGLQPTVPEGYDYDYINTDALLNRLSVNAQGHLVLPDGMEYRVLVLPQTDKMTVAVLEKIHTLVQAGATVVGPRPMQSPSLADHEPGNPYDLAEDLWGGLDGISRNRREVGQGQVYWGWPLEQVLRALKIAPDLEHDAPLDAQLEWIHRRTDQADLYFIANQSDQPLNVNLRLRVTGRAPQLWAPDTGSIDNITYSTSDSKTTVTLSMAPFASSFVVLGQATEGSSHQEAVPQWSVVETLSGPWTVTFPAGLGAPAQIELPELINWMDHEDPGVAYFSGTATYHKTWEVPVGASKSFRLDLGRVRDLAEVRLNGQSLGILWKPPYQVDVTQALHPGRNELEIRVTNTWANRQAGDLLLPEDQRILPPPGLDPRFFGPSQAVESGLLGPVILQTQNKKH